MIDIRPPTRLFVRRSWPITLPVRARREMSPIWGPLGPLRVAFSPFRNPLQPHSIRRRQRTALTLTPVIDRAEVKTPNKRRVDFVQPEF